MPTRRVQAAVDIEPAAALPQPSTRPETKPERERRGPSPHQLSEGRVRVDVGLLNQLMNQVGELVLARNQIRPFAEAIPDRVFANAAQQLDHITSELQEGIMKTRMQPIGGLVVAAAARGARSGPVVQQAGRNWTCTGGRRSWTAR